LAWAWRSRPAGGSLMLGGDFFDAVELTDSRVRVVIGDVCGHGPDEAALGVALRIAWRSLVLAGVEDDQVLHHVESILKVERGATDLFVTMCDLTISADRGSMSIRVGGHPPPLLVSPHYSTFSVVPGVPLGVLDHPEWPTTDLSLPPGWALLMYTDGLVEGRNDRGERAWSDEGLAAAIRSASWSAADLRSLADQVITAAEGANGGPLDDDVAVLLLAQVQE
jgi:serine phosphatase RsbU (regulator of sigma subunit)